MTEDFFLLHLWNKSVYIKHLFIYTYILSLDSLNMSLKVILSTQEHNTVIEKWIHTSTLAETNTWILLQAKSSWINFYEISTVKKKALKICLGKSNGVRENSGNWI